MEDRFANYAPHVRKAWASVHLELTTMAKEKRILRKRSPQKKKFDEDTVTFHPKPRGRAPEGKSWEPIHGEWVDTSPTKVKSLKQNKKKQASSSPAQSKQPTNRNKTRGKAPKQSSNTTKRKTRSVVKLAKQVVPKVTTSSPLINSQQRQSANKVMMDSTTRVPIMPSPKRLEQRLEENSGGNLALAATPPSPVKRTSSSHHVSPIPKPLFQKGDALATMWGIPSKVATSFTKNKPLGKASGGMLAEISNTRKRKTDDSAKVNHPAAKKPRVTKTELGKKNDEKKKTNPLAIRESKRPLIQREDGTFARPPGKPPQGFSWDEEGGAWVSKVDVTTAARTSKQRPVPRRKPQKQIQKKEKTSTSMTLSVPKTKTENVVSPTKSSTREPKQKENHITSSKDETSKLSTRSSPNNTKEHHRSQQAGFVQCETTGKRVQRRTVPTDSLYSPTKSEPSMQHNAKASRGSPRAELTWDNTTGSSVPQTDLLPENLLSRQRKQPERFDRPLQSVLKQPKLAQCRTESPGNRFSRSPILGAATSMLASPSFHSSPRNGFHAAGTSPDGSRGSNRSRSFNQPIYSSGRSRNQDSRQRRRSINFVAHAPLHEAQAMATESRDFVACGDCLNCRLPINCGACLLCKNSLHFGSLFPSCVRRICVSPVLPPLQRVSMVHFSTKRSPAAPVGSPPRRSPKKLSGSGSGLLGSFGKYRDKDEQSMDESEPALSKTSVQTEDITDVVESLHADSDDDISDF